MMYGHELAIAIKCGGKILREVDKDKVYLPFGSEYSILVKNLSSLRTQINIDIDCNRAVKDVVIEPNSSTELERFLEDRNLAKGNRFKFIERTGAVENHRGIKIDDGIVRVEYQFAKPATEHIYHDVVHHYYDHYRRDMLPSWYWHGNGYSSSELIGSGISAQTAKGPLRGVTYSASMSACGASADASAPVAMNFCQFTQQSMNDSGITAKGSVSDQKFKLVNSFPLQDTKHSLLLYLRGAVGEKPVETPVTVTTKKACTSCGHLNKVAAKFCSHCGTSLEII